MTLKTATPDPATPDPATPDPLGPILQPPPRAPRAPRLPGTAPVDPDAWLLRCEAFGAQMALRDRLVAEGAEGLAMRAEAREAVGELLDAVLDRLGRDAGYRVGATEVRRPDGVAVAVEREAPLATLARLVQEDLCLLQPGPEGHRLTAGVLLFPSFWRLADKIGRALPAIHAPVADYDPEVARRVQRLFDALRPGLVLERWNWLPHDEPWLHMPRPEAVRRETSARPAYLRRERQCLLRLPRTGAVVFSIHSFVSRMEGEGAPAPAAGGAPPARA